MIKSDQKALFMDLDGTLLTDSKEITEDNRKAIDSLLSKGHFVVITTGRPLVSAVIQARKLGLTGPGCCLIAFNGCTLYDSFAEKILFDDTIDLALVERLFREAVRRGLHMQCYDETRCLALEGCDLPALKRYCSRIDMNYRLISDVSSLTYRPEKVMVIDFDSHERLENYREWVSSWASDLLDCNFSCPEYLEIMNKGRSKGTALLETVDRLGLSLPNTYAVGDAENDISMITAAGTGIAVANAADAVKQAADHITERDNNHDAIAELINNYILS